MFDTYADIFIERAREYHGAMTASPDAREAEFRAVIEPIRNAPAGLVCDMPSGGCYLPRYLPPGMGYVAVEPVEDFLDSRARSHRTLISTIDKVPLPDGSVDYVISLAGLHHEESLPRVFAEMRRLLRPRGRLVIADAAVDTGPARFLNGFVARNNPMGHDGRFLDSDTGWKLEGAGFHILADEQVEMPWRFDSSDEAAAFCGSLFGMSQARPQEIADSLADEIGFTEDNGRLYLAWTLRRIVCEPN